MGYYANPTEAAAAGKVDRELRLLRKRAEQIKRRRQQGLLTPEELAQHRKVYVGIFAHLLREALED